MLLVAQLLCLLGLALGNSDDLQNGTVHAAPSAVVLERGPCPVSWFYNGRCFKYVSSGMSWAAAELNCVSQGANLVSIHSQGEHHFVLNLIQNFQPEWRRTWIGLSDTQLEGRYMWSDGASVGYTMWDNGEPNGIESQNCVYTNHVGKPKWHDYGCAQNNPSVCVLRTA